MNQVQLQAKCHAYFKQKDLEPMIPMMNFKSNYATQIHVQTERKLTSNKADQMHFNFKKTQPSWIHIRLSSVPAQLKSNTSEPSRRHRPLLDISSARGNVSMYLSNVHWHC